MTCNQMNKLKILIIIYEMSYKVLSNSYLSWGISVSETAIIRVSNNIISRKFYSDVGEYGFVSSMVFLFFYSTKFKLFLIL